MHAQAPLGKQLLSGSDGDIVRSGLDAVLRQSGNIWRRSFQSLGNPLPIKLPMAHERVNLETLSYRGFLSQTEGLPDGNMGNTVNKV